MARKGNRTKRREKKHSGNHDVLGVILFIIALFLLLCTAIPPFLSVFSQAIHAVFLGVFGILTYPMLLAVLFWSVCLVMRRSFNGVSTRITVCIILLILFVSMILQLATTHNYLNEKFTDYISDVYAAKFTMGGVIFGTLAFGLKSAITEIGCYVVLSVAVLVTIAVMINVVGLIRNRKNRVKPDAPEKPKRPRFGEETEAQGVITTPNRGKLTLIEIQPPRVNTSSGSTATLSDNGRREVSDYGENPVVDNDDEEARERERNVHALYADVETITKRETEEFNRRAAGLPPEPERETYSAPYTGPAPQAPTAPTQPMQNVAPQAAQPPAQPPRRIDHDASEVPPLAFPVRKDIQFNRDGIESIGDMLRETSERRKRSEYDNSQTPPIDARPQSPEFSSRATDRVKPPSDIFDTRSQNNDIFDTPPRDDIVQVGRDEDRAAVGQPSVQDPIRSPFDTYTSRDDELLESLGRSNSGGEIINIGQIQQDADSVRTPVEGEIIDAGAAAIEPIRSSDDGRSIRDIPSRGEPVRNSSPIINAEAPIEEPQPPRDVDSGIINAHEPETRTIGGLVIDDGPAVDMSESHDINGDLIEGSDLSGMYTSVDEQPKPTAPRAKKPTPVIPDQISIDSVLRDNADSAVTVTEGRRRKKYDYAPPPIDLLRINERATVPTESLQETAATLETVVSGFLKAEVKVINIVPGPTVTRYEIELPSGVPVKQIEARASDIEYELATISKIRIEAPIPGKRAVGIEVPNREKAIVGLRDIIESNEFAHTKSPMTISVGKDIAGEVVLCDLEKIPHLLIAGQTGSGKSACLNGLIISLLYKASPEDLRFILVDPKRVEFSKYRSMPHLLFDNIVYEPNEVLSALKWAANEMERRYMLMSKYGCSQLSAYNSLPDVKNGKYDKIPHIIVIIDELADIMSSQFKRDIEEKIKVIAAKARAAGIHLIVATQRPSADVITGTIKTNLTSRIAFKVSTQLDSRIIFDTQGAEALVGNGDMLFYPVTYSAPRRVQGSYISDEEVSAVIMYIKEHYESDFDEDAANAVFGGGNGGAGGVGGDGNDNEDVLMPDVLAFVIKAGNASTSSIQRRFSIGYARAARIIDIMEQSGYIGKPTGSSKPREVFITPETYRELYNRDVDEN